MFYSKNLITFVAISLCIILESAAYIRRKLNQDEIKELQQLKFPQDSECGTYGRGRIPWLFTLTRKYDDKYLCDGILIYPDVLMTSAHCVENHMNDYLEVTSRHDDHIFSHMTITPLRGVVSEIHINPTYEACSRHNSFAILILSKPFEVNTLSIEFRVACLPLLHESYYTPNCDNKFMESQLTIGDELNDDNCGDRVFEAPELPYLMEEASCEQGNGTAALIKETRTYSLLCELTGYRSKYYYLGTKVRVEMCGPDKKGYWFYDTLYKHLPWIHSVLRNRILDYDLYEDSFDLCSFT